MLMIKNTYCKHFYYNAFYPNEVSSCLVNSHMLLKCPLFVSYGFIKKQLFVRSVCSHNLLRRFTLLFEHLSRLDKVFHRMNLNVSKVC